MFKTLSDAGHVVRFELLGRRQLLVAGALEPKEVVATLREQVDSPFMVDLAAAAGLPPMPAYPGPLLQYQWLTLVDNEPWSISTLTIPVSLAPPQWHGDFRGLVRYIAAEHGVRLRTSVRRVSPGSADSHDARWLPIAAGAPVQLVNTVRVDQAGETVAFVAHRVRGDRYEYVQEASRDHGSPAPPDPSA
jgi:hypothetical protein